MPNFHACRLRQPGDFQANSFRTTEREHNGKKYNIVMGKLKNQDSMTEQAYRYPTEEWDASAARSHCSDHNGILFEPAEKSGDSEIKSVPPNVSTTLADEGASWSAPSLSDFTSGAWGDLSDSDKRKIAGHFAWARTMPPETYGDLKLPHHDPKSGNVVWRGVAAAMAALLGARGGVDVGSDKQAVYNHLAAHYRAFGKEPPELNSVDLDELGEQKSLIIHKKVSGVEIGEIKETDSGPVGSFRATFSTFNVVDKDYDVTEPGAIQSGQQVKICQWGHGWGVIPIGKGVLGTDGTRAWVDGELFLDIPVAKDHYVAIKNLGELTEWSYGFEVQEYSFSEVDGRQVRVLKKLHVYEVSPVMVGAGVGTRTDAIKSGVKFSDHSKSVISEIEAYLDRIKSLSDLRAKDGRVLSAANLQTLDDILAMFDEVTSRLRALRETATSSSDKNKAASDLRARLLKERLRTERLNVSVRSFIRA
jgi:HK97 family phage prohead protease